MVKTYTDYINKIAISIPDKFIDVKTGETHAVSQKLQEQIEYHANNSTLIHLVFSALDQYLKPKAANGVTEEILLELSEIKRMIENGYIPLNHSPQSFVSKNKDLTPKSVDLKEVEDILEAFGG
ncbi:hypothetical protein C0966_05230 [Bacillus methanolicus]|uniref:hypothetical protein n=1 Tax=Bacillus methanolicus TaxID=1471 RepID=UPI0023807D83|nr:hypothetical protein [Bacillus methanolicus]MDE3838782.1 hypothetical protein [Bacillus methanolicus]